MGCQTNGQCPLVIYIGIRGLDRIGLDWIARGSWRFFPVEIYQCHTRWTSCWISGCMSIWIYVWMDGNGQLSKVGEAAEFESRSTLEALLI